MSRPSLRRLVPFISAAILAACSQNDAVDPSVPPPPPPPAPTSFDWSDPNAWPDHAVPLAGAAVTIPAGKTFVLDVSPPALRSLTIDGTLQFARKDLSLTTDWIVVHGAFQIGTEANPYTQHAVITLTGQAGENIEGVGAKVLAAIGGTIDFHGRTRTTWTKLSATASSGSDQLQLVGPIDWAVGEHIVVASTDFDPLQAEEGIITAVAGSQVTLQAKLKYPHWGQLQTFAGRPLDERAEVGLLTRNIVIQGDSASLASGLGGHMIITAGGVARIEGVELTRMGQKKLLARYPMHWHMEGPVDGQYFRNNAVWKTFNRCLTIHGSHHATAIGNVCYNNIGHAYFLEDGVETGNTLEHNLGLVTQKPATGEAVLPSDNDPATFWITNPDNTYRGNVAAGSRGFGFWFALPNAPTGLSTGSSARPRLTPLREFTDNVAHSNRNTGLNVDLGPMPDGNVETAHYSPHQDPADPESALVTASFRNFVGWKHSGRAVWLRGSQLRLANPLLADNHIGATFASDETFVQDAVIVGASANNATAFSRGFPVRGYEFYDGRVGAERVTFVNFQPTANNYMSGLGYNRQNGFPINPGNYGKQLTFVNANEVYLENPLVDRDGDKAAVMFDADGSLTGVAGQSVAVNNPLLVTNACTLKAAWNAYVCAQRFVNLQIRTADQQAVAPLSLSRDDGATSNFVGVPDAAWVVSSTVVPARTYAVGFQAGAPLQPQVYANGLVATDWIKVTLPYPNAQFTAYRDYNTNSLLTAVASLAELDGSTGNRYFYDAGAAKLSLKLVPQNGRTWATVFVLPK